MYSRDLLWPSIPFIDQQSHHQYQDLFDHHQTQLQPHSIPLFPMPPMENLFFHEYSYDQYGSRPLMNHIEYQSPENFSMYRVKMLLQQGRKDASPCGYRYRYRAVPEPDIFPSE